MYPISLSTSSVGGEEKRTSPSRPHVGSLVNNLFHLSERVAATSPEAAAQLLAVAKSLSSAVRSKYKPQFKRRRRQKAKARLKGQKYRRRNRAKIKRYMKRYHKKRKHHLKRRAKRRHYKRVGY